MSKGSLKRIHVNKHVIASNRKKELHHEPPLTVKVGKRNIRTHSIQIHGPSLVVYRPEKPLKCGATVWIETNAMVTTTYETLA